MPVNRWAAPAAIANLATTELNSLANNARAEGVIFDNTVNRYLFADVELAVQFTVAPTSTGDLAIQLYMVPSIDGTNYADGGVNTAPGVESFVTNFVLKSSTNAQRIPALRIPLDPFKYKPIIVNLSGQAFPASGSTIRIVAFNFESV